MCWKIFKIKQWELVEEDRPMIQTSFNPLTEMSFEKDVLVDVYRKKKRNGIYKYKNVVKSRYK
jgi:hypothetical protein